MCTYLLLHPLLWRTIPPGGAKRETLDSPARFPGLGERPWWLVYYRLGTTELESSLSPNHSTGPRNDDHPRTHPYPTTQRAGEVLRP